MGSSAATAAAAADMVSPRVATPSVRRTIRAAESLMRIRGTAGDASDRCPHCGEPVDQEPHTTLNVTLEATLRRVLETPRTTEEPADVRL